MMKNIFFGAALACTMTLAQAQVAVVAGAKSAAQPLTQAQAEALYAGKTSQAPGLGSAALIDLPESDPVRDSFYSKVTGKSAAQAKAIWSRLTFSGKATPPREVGDAAAVKKAVNENPNSIGYIPAAAADGSVKVLLTVN